MHSPKKDLFRDIAIVSAITVLLVTAFAMASPQDTDTVGSVRLQAQAHVSQKEVRLRHVARLEGAEALRLGEVVVGEFKEKQLQLTVKRTQVRQLLSARVDLGNPGLGCLRVEIAYQLFDHLQVDLGPGGDERVGPRVRGEA